MLMMIDRVCIDTDYPEEYIPQIKTILPDSLGDTIADRLKEWQEFSDKIDNLESEVADADSRLTEIKECRDKVQDMLTKLSKAVKDKDVKEALNYIHEELNNI